METKELYLKTLFCCSACDGDIAPEEVNLVKDFSLNEKSFEGFNVEEVINGYITEINKQGKLFLKEYLNEVNDANLSNEEQLKIIELAIRMIEADNQILYSEVKFFKKLRNRLSVKDETILKKYPEYEDYLLPDINSEDKELEDIGNFELIYFAEALDKKL